MFNKEEQRRRAEELNRKLLGEGVKPPAPQPVPVVSQPSMAIWTTTDPGSTQYGLPLAQEPRKTAKPPKAKDYFEIEFLNELNQIIKPGDTVIYVTEGTNRAKISLAVYLGKSRAGGAVINKVGNKPGRMTLRSNRIFPTR